MIEDLKNKVVLITGSSTGIGAAAAIAFGKNGAKVARSLCSSGYACQRFRGPGDKKLRQQTVRACPIRDIATGSCACPLCPF